jgi:transposase
LASRWRQPRSLGGVGRTGGVGRLDFIAADGHPRPRREAETLDAQIDVAFAEHHHAATIQSMPGFGPILGASLLVAAADLRAFPTAGHLAAAVGLAPVPNDSGRRSGNLHRPRRYSRPLRHVFYLSAHTSMTRAGPNREYYLNKRAHGHIHSQAVIALARRRVDVLWALLPDRRRWEQMPPTPAPTG